MKLEKARELLLQDIADPGSVDIMDLNIAEALGAEALKLIKLGRTGVQRFAHNILPGETEDSNPHEEGH